MIPFDEIDSRLDALGLDRAWLAVTSGRKINSIRVALAPNSDPKNRSELLQRVLSDAIEKEEERRKKAPELPDRVTLEVSPQAFEAYNLTSMEEGLTLKQWCIEVLNREAKQAREKKEAAKTVPFVSPAREKIVTMGEHTVIQRGSVAAGGKLSADVTEEEIPTGKRYPSDHYALRVDGQSMEPDIPDGSLIIVKSFLDQGFPKAGKIVVYDDGHGATLKVFDRVKSPDAEHASLGKIPVLRSINPDFPDVQPIEGGRIVAVFVEILQEG